MTTPDTVGPMTDLVPLIAGILRDNRPRRVLLVDDLLCEQEQEYARLIAAGIEHVFDEKLEEVRALHFPQKRTDPDGYGMYYRCSCGFPTWRSCRTALAVYTPDELKEPESFRHDDGWNR